MWGPVPETNSYHQQFQQQFQTPCFTAPDIIQAAMNHADPNTMRATTLAMLLEKKYIYGCGLFPPHVLRLLVVAQRHESAVPQVCIAGPLDIFKLPHQHRL